MESRRERGVGGGGGGMICQSRTLTKKRWREVYGAKKKATAVEPARPKTLGWLFLWIIISFAACVDAAYIVSGIVFAAWQHVLYYLSVIATRKECRQGEQSWQ